MNKVSLRALRSLEYDGKALKAGDTFEANSIHARILIGLRKATRQDEISEPKTDERPRRRYRRRDMTVEE